MTRLLLLIALLLTLSGCQTKDAIVDAETGVGFVSNASFLFVAPRKIAQRNDGNLDGPADRRAEFYKLNFVALEGFYRQITGSSGKSIVPIGPTDVEFDCMTLKLPFEYSEAFQSIKAADVQEYAKI